MNYHVIVRNNQLQNLLMINKIEGFFLHIMYVKKMLRNQITLSPNTYTMLQFVGNQYKYNRNVNPKRQLTRKPSFIGLSTTFSKKNKKEKNSYDQEDHDDLYN